MNYLFKDRGLIFCNPTDIEFKNFNSGIFKRIKYISSYLRNCKSILRQNLEVNYEPQVKPKPINLFFNYNSNRYLIEPGTDDLFGLKNTRKKICKNEIFEILDANPDYFSSNVVLRPVFQDYLLPTVAYIGVPRGSLFCSVEEDVYEFFNVTMPVIFPRTSITLLENKVTAFFEKYQLNFEDFLDSKAIRFLLLEKLDVINVENIFGKYKDEFRSLSYTFEKQLDLIDKNLSKYFPEQGVISSSKI